MSCTWLLYKCSFLNDATDFTTNNDFYLPKKVWSLSTSSNNQTSTNGDRPKSIYLYVFLFVFFYTLREMNW